MRPRAGRLSAPDRHRTRAEHGHLADMTCAYDTGENQRETPYGMVDRTGSSASQNKLAREVQFPLLFGTTDE
jgi:hypothetical protein